MDRRNFLLLPLAAIPVGGYARFVEPEWLELTHERIPLPGLTGTDTVRLVQLSDFHASNVVPTKLIEHSIDIALAQKPDLICLTGDYITEGEGFDPTWYTRVLSRIPKNVPCFATLGNHDGGAWSYRSQSVPYTTEGVKLLLKLSGIPLLFNSWQEIQVREHRLRLVGLGDMWANDCHPDLAFHGIPDDQTTTVVLSHNPDSKSMMADYRWNLMLSGHTHGGQVVMPVLGISPAPVNDRRYIKGLKPWNDRLIYVSAGIGNIDGIRFNCRPQVSLLELHAPSPNAV